jgi:predicted PurR-regulated permease PerM
MHARGRRGSVGRALLHGLWTFLRTYVLRLGFLDGRYGLLLAIPAAACIKILLREIFWPRFRDWATGKADDVLPISKD